MRQTSHRLIVLEYVAPQATHACKSRSPRQESGKRRPETDSLPIVGDYKREFGRFRVCVSDVASFRNERHGLINCAIMDLGDESNMSTIIGHRKLPQELLRKFIDGVVKSQPARRLRQRREKRPQGIQIRRKNPSDRDLSRVIELYAHEMFSA
jgi:hypothetical protein